MFGFFKKKDTPDPSVKARVIRFIDDLLVAMYAQGRQGKKSDAERMRKRIKAATLSKRQSDRLLAVIGKTNLNSVDDAYVGRILAEFDRILSGSESSGAESRSEKNDALLEQYADEVAALNYELVQVERKIEDALENGDRVQWTILNRQKESLQSRIILKRKGLNALAEKKANLEISDETENLKQLDRYLSHPSNYVDTEEVERTLSEFDAAEEMLRSESNALSESILSRGEADDFDRAYEKHMIEKQRENARKERGAAKNEEK